MDSFVQNVFTTIGFGVELFFVETGVCIRRKVGEVGMKEIIIAYDENAEATPVMGDWVGELVRCKDCKHCYVDGENVRFNVCELDHNKVQSGDWFCADGEQRTEV